MLALMVIMTACSLTDVPLISTVQPQNAISPTPDPSPEALETTPSPEFSMDGVTWTDELAVMGGICFESAFDAAGRTFVLRSEAELSQFFDLADNSRLCRQPVGRAAFDFSNGRILAGLWSYGRGCTARHEVLSVAKDDNAKTLLMRLKFITEGGCSYELVRPFWIGLAGVPDYAIEFIVE
jgi:hypothetical protein